MGLAGGGDGRGNERTGSKGRSEGTFERQDLKERILVIFNLKRFVIIFSYFLSSCFYVLWRSEEEYEAFKTEVTVLIKIDTMDL